MPPPPPPTIPGSKGGPEIQIRGTVRSILVRIFEDLEVVGSHDAVGFNEFSKSNSSFPGHSNCQYRTVSCGIFQFLKVPVCLIHLSLASFLWDIGKQNSPRCDAAEHVVPSGVFCLLGGISSKN